MRPAGRVASEPMTLCSPTRDRRGLIHTSAMIAAPAYPTFSQKYHYELTQSIIYFSRFVPFTLTDLNLVKNYFQLFVLMFPLKKLENLFGSVEMLNFRFVK